MKPGSARKLSDFELRAELNRLYAAEHGLTQSDWWNGARPHWLGDDEYLAEVRANAERRLALESQRRETVFAKAESKAAEQPKEPSTRKAHGGGLQDVVLMVRAHGSLTKKEAAEHLGVTLDAAWGRLRRAIQTGLLTQVTDGKCKRYALPQ